MKPLFRFKVGVVAGRNRDSYGEAFQDAVDFIEAQIKHPPKRVVIQRLWSYDGKWFTEAFVTVSAVVEALKMDERPTA